MRYSYAIILSLFVMLAITGAIGVFAYVSTGETVSVFRELANHHERVRNELSELESLINTSDRKFVLFARIDQIYEDDLRITFRYLKDQIDDIRNTSPIKSSLTQDKEFMQSAFEQFLRTHAERNTRPGAWKTAYSQLRRFLAAARTALSHLAGQNETNHSLTSYVKTAATMLNVLEIRVRQFADEQTATILEVVAPLNDAKKLLKNWMTIPRGWPSFRYLNNWGCYENPSPNLKPQPYF